MFETAKLLNRIIAFLERLYFEYRKREREKAIEKILDNPDDAWGRRFGYRLPDDERGPE